MVGVEGCGSLVKRQLFNVVASVALPWHVGWYANKLGKVGGIRLENKVKNLRSTRKMENQLNMRVRRKTR